jgi:hypothetical protein
LKPLDVEIQVVDKQTNTDPINITTQKGTKLVEVRKILDAKVQIVEIPSVLTNRNPIINKATLVHEEDMIPKVNRENINTIRESHAIKTPYRHPTHKSRYINKSVYQHHSK